MARTRRRGRGRGLGVISARSGFHGSGAPGSGQEIVEKATTGDVDGLRRLLAESYSGGDAQLDSSVRAIRSAQVRTAAQRAAHAGQFHTLKLLLDHGADLGLNLGNGRAIAVEAATRGHADVLRLLLAPKAGDGEGEGGEKDARCSGAGVSTEVQNGYGRTALMEAAKNGHAECVEVAIEAGAEIDFATKNANVTAAMFAAMEGHTACLNVLRNAGANLEVARNQDGKTAMQMHRERVAAEMAKLKATAAAQCASSE